MSTFRKVCLVLAFCLKISLFGVTQESAIIQEMRLGLENISHRLHSQNVEMNIFQERILHFENALETLKQEFKAPGLEKIVEKRLLSLEKAQDLFINDLKTLKIHFNETRAALDLCQGHLNKIDKQLSSDIQSLKTSLQTMLTLLQPQVEQHFYIVKPGDSLGQIALDHKTNIKVLKELNNMSTDIIYSGQKLILP